MESESESEFDTEDYLQTRFCDVNVQERILFPLEMFHKEFSALPGSLKILEYGTGPVVMTLISAARKASEIILAEYSSRNRDALRSWLDNEPNAFNWSPFFEHVVQNLEVNGVEEAVTREALVREKVTSVISCDIYSSPIVAEGFEGPYDVVSSSCCLESVCSTRETFKQNVKKLSALVKPGGRMMLYLSERNMEPESGVYYTGSQRHVIVSLSAPFVADVLRSIGYSSVKNISCPGDPKLLHTFQDENLLGYMFVSGVKKEVTL